MQSTDPATRARVAEYWDWRWQRRASLLRQSVTRLGPAFIKLGQALASRPDIVGTVTARELQRLQDDMPFFSNAEAFDFIRSELGASPNRIFDDISERPVAAASLGQVYKGTLEGLPVAIKVQRPGVDEQIALDFFIVRILFSAIERFLGVKTDLVGAADEYASRLFEELDYVNEGKNIAKFRALYGKMRGIYVPQIYEWYTTPHVLVMEWVNGEKLVDESLSVRSEDIELIEVGIECSLTQLLEKGFLHCDPHASNLIRTADGRLAYIDFGLVSTVPDAVMESILKAVLHLVSREYVLLAEDFAGLALMRSDDLEQQLPDFAAALEDVFDPWMREGISRFSFQGITEKLLVLTGRFPLVLPPYFLNNVRALAILEGLAMTADPDFNMFNVIYPYVLRRVLYNPSAELVGALEHLIMTEDGSVRWKRLESLVSDAATTKERQKDNSISKDLLMGFIFAPGGRIVREVLVEQVIADFTYRFEFFMDNVQSIILPPHLLPPSGCVDECSDLDLQYRLRENRAQARSLFLRLRAYKSIQMVRFLPFAFAAGLRFGFSLARAILARILMDAWFIFGALRRNVSSKITSGASTPIAQEQEPDAIPRDASTREIPLFDVPAAVDNGAPPPSAPKASMNGSGESDGEDGIPLYYGQNGHPSVQRSVPTHNRPEKD